VLKCLPRAYSDPDTYQYRNVSGARVERAVEGYGPRLKAAGQYVRDCKTLYENALKARNSLVVEAVDNGYSGHQASRDIECKQPHIVRILSGSQPGLTLDAA
jgi:hypothetical protein